MPASGSDRVHASFSENLGCLQDSRTHAIYGADMRQATIGSRPERTRRRLGPGTPATRAARREALVSGIGPTTRRLVSRFGRLDALTLDAIAIGLVLAAVSFGIFRTTEPVSTQSNGTRLSVVDDRHAFSAARTDSGTAVRAAGDVGTAAPVAERREGTDGARECAPAQGIESNCIFD